MHGVGALLPVTGFTETLAFLRLHGLEPILLSEHGGAGGAGEAGGKTQGVLSLSSL